jgi:hypothetical protein
MAATATVRVGPEVRDGINELAAARGIKASQLLGQHRDDHLDRRLVMRADLERHLRAHGCRVMGERGSHTR